MSYPLLALASVVMWTVGGVALLRYARRPGSIRRTAEQRARLYAGANLFRDIDKQVRFEGGLSVVVAWVFFACAGAMLVVLIAQEVLRV